MMTDWIATSEGHVRAKHIVRVFNKSNQWGHPQESGATIWFTRYDILAETTTGSTVRLEGFDFDEADPDALTRKMTKWLTLIVGAD